MLIPSNSELISVWERGAREHPIDRALTLLSACSGQTREDLARLSIGARDARLLQAYEHIFGPDLAAFAQCPACQEPMEYKLSADEMLASMAPGDASALTFQDGDLNLRLRLPDSLDLRVASASADPELAAKLLAQRCIVEATAGQQTLPHAGLPARISEAISCAVAAADPGAEILINLSCAVCSHAWQVTFDIERFLWARISVAARRLLRDVHALALAYGWSESDILALTAVRRQYYLEMAWPTS